MLLNRIRPHLDDNFWPNQCGFILKAYGIPKIIVHAIEDTYKSYYIRWWCRWIWHPSRSPTRQHPSTILFIIVLDYCLRSAIEVKEERLGFTIRSRRSQRDGPVIITDLDFADLWHCTFIWHCCTSTRAAQ